MDQRPGELVGNMLWLVARYPERPGVIMRLGSILRDPENLESSLNLHAIEPIEPVSQRDASLSVRDCVESHLRRDNSALVQATAWIPVLSGITAGASAEGRWTHDVHTTVQALDVNATVFIPSAAYMQRALDKSADVQTYVRKGLFGKPLYMVVGVATAKRLALKETMTHEHGTTGSLRVGGDGTAAVPVSAGAEARRESVAAGESELEVGEACDFAYRVREFFYSKMFSRLKDRGDRTVKTMFSGQYDPTKDLELEPKFEYFEPEDASASGMLGLATGSGV